MVVIFLYDGHFMTHLVPHPTHSLHYCFLYSVYQLWVALLFYTLSMQVIGGAVVLGAHSIFKSAELRALGGAGVVQFKLGKTVWAGRENIFSSPVHQS